jgi:RNA polymerase sigma-70 factor (ECF subfamily)
MKPGQTKNSKEGSAATLYEAIRSGDEVAFAHYYEISFDRLVTLIQRITKDTEEAKNIVNDTFAKLWQMREQIDPAQLLDGFVSTISTNAALDFLKKRHAHAKYHSEQLYLHDDEDLSADARMLESEAESRIREAIRRMPAQRRRVYELSRDENLTYNEIAERLGISPNTVRNHMALALEDIRKVLSSFVLLLIFSQY